MRGFTDIETVTLAGLDIPGFMGGKLLVNEDVQLGIGEHLIPQGALRARLAELPPDQDREIIVYCAISLRGYECAAILEGHGWRNVRVMEGGVAAWPYPRER